MTEFQKSVLGNLAGGAVIGVVAVVLELELGYPLIHLLSDGFFVAAVMLLGIGGITAARNAGCFDLMGYSMKTLFGLMTPGSRLGDPSERETFVDYKEKKAEKRRSPAPMLLAGVIYLILAGIMLAIYFLTM
jgi:hypothetical protein